ncbi:MAG: hypothetical protein ABIP56_08775 [Dokdonella sp.]
MPFLREFLLIMGLGTVVAGLTTYIIISILVTTHLRDNHPIERERLGANIASPRLFGWYLFRRYVDLGDRTLKALAAPGWIGTWAIVVGAVCIFISKGTQYV